MPEICKAMKKKSFIPATSCSAERSFSCLRRLKTYLRSTMLQERLSNLAIMSIKPTDLLYKLDRDSSGMPGLTGFSVPDSKF